MESGVWSVMKKSLKTSFVRCGFRYITWSNNNIWFLPTFTYNSDASIWISPFISTLSLESNVYVGRFLNLIKISGPTCSKI